MTPPDNPPQSLPGQPQYARFSRRLRGMFIDWTITLAVIFGALMIGAAMRNDDISRVLGMAVILVVILYEPVLVSRTGGTIGHHLTNLRVVDDGHGGHVSFLKAVARFVVKGAIGWYSFILMAATRRNQAIHDLVTRSTVQIRDSAKASPGEFITERVEFSHASMPSRWRRIAVICAYLLSTLVLYYYGVIGLALDTGVVSMRCAETDVCSRSEDIYITAIGLSLLAVCAACIVLGWKAKLPGARRA
jgi:uncharacterized RDD family membrane protein YckC